MVLPGAIGKRHASTFPSQSWNGRPARRCTGNLYHPSKLGGIPPQRAHVGGNYPHTSSVLP
ncbi:hypothetical protein BQ8420_03440 [Nocardiopsis sp. JB363]|nr:hypothetical protein BQ8420_03440 [Nocardiopsis sp. JB363]